MASTKKKVAKSIAKRLTPTKKDDPPDLTPHKPGLATTSRIAKKDEEIRKYAAANGRAAAIQKYGKKRVDEVPMSTKKIGEPPTPSKAGEGPYGISGQPMTGRPTLMAQDKYPSDISGVSRHIPVGRRSRRKGGKVITYKMSGGQVVDAGYD